MTKLKKEYKHKWCEVALGKLPYVFLSLIFHSSPLTAGFKYSANIVQLPELGKPSWGTLGMEALPRGAIRAKNLES